MKTAFLFAVALAGLAAAQAPQSESGMFVYSQAGTEVITEKFTRSATAIEAELRVPSGQRVTYKARVADGVVSEITLSSFAPEDSVKPAQSASFRFRADTMTLETTRNGAAVTEKRAAPPGTVPYINPSVLWMEEIVRKAKAAGGTSASVSVAFLNAPQEVMPITVTFKSATEASVLLGDTQITFTLDQRGRILRGAVPSQNLTIARK
jgi:hypothetical protein